MADLAVGLSKTVVEGALARVRTVIEEEAKLRQKAQRDLVLISLEFEMMQSFLDFANDKMSSTKNNMVRTWVRHVRELANDLEDCVEFVVHLDDKPIFWRRLFPCCIAQALPLDQAVAEIEDIKGRAEELSKCYMRYSSIADSSGSKFVMLQQEPSSRAIDATASNLLSKARVATRRGRGLGDLIQLITKKIGDELQVISVWGTGGEHGTTSIIRKAYNDPEISQNFACRSWVKLMHPFNPREFVRRFMAQVYANACEQQGTRVGVHVLEKMEASQEDLLKEFVEQVNSKTYLVVLENLSDMVDWDAVKTFLPDLNNGSSIIVSTQHLEIASLCIGHSYQPLELKQLLPDHSICAFFKEGSQDYENKEEKSMVPSLYGNIPSYDMKEVCDWMTNYPLVGRDREMNELRRCTAVARFRNSPVIAVRGIAGIGKSALVRYLFYDRMLNGVQFNKYCWVDVSHPLNLRDFSRSLISDHHSEKDPIKECNEFLRMNRCLVVIDDLQSKEEWDLIQAALVSRNLHSIIIVITTEASIATYCTNYEDQVLNVKGLEAAAAMDLFRVEVKRNNPSCPLHDHQTAELEELIVKCGGLPKVIVSIAAFLATQTVTFMETVRSFNHKFMHHLENCPEYDSLVDLFDWMGSYFRTFPDLLKPCIFYLAVFPPHCTIRRGRLVRRWIAEGYSRDGEEESAVDKAENFFTKLLELSIIQGIPQLITTAFGDNKLVSWQVNSFMHEYIISRRMEENLVFELGPNCVLTTQRTGRHLIILDTWVRDRIVFESIDFSRLRSLTVFGEWESFFISKSMRLLRVLDLEDAWGVEDEDLKVMVQRMLRLKFLSLRGQHQIFCLPNSLGDLRQLQTLDVRHTSIVTLPASIGKLQKLQYIRAGSKVPASTPLASSSNRLPQFLRGRGLISIKVPIAIGKLTALHTLGIINVGASGGKAIVEELSKLTQLRKLGVSGINKHNSKEFLWATPGRVHLESLLMQLDKDSRDCLDRIPLPWNNLQSVKLYGLKDKLPLPASHLNKLRKLEIEMETIQKNDIKFLARLPELSILRLRVNQVQHDKLYGLEDNLPLSVSHSKKLWKLELDVGTLKKNDIEFLAMLPELCILSLRVKQAQDDTLHFHDMFAGCELSTFEKVKILEIACTSSKVFQVVFGLISMKKLELLKVDCSRPPVRHIVLLA